MSNIVVIGPGAIGAAMAGALMSTGRHDVVIGARTPFDELVVEHPGGTERHRPRVCIDADEIDGPVDLMVLATKTHQTIDARPWLDAAGGDGTVVAALQNGIEHEDRLQPIVGDSALAPTIVFCPSERIAPGHVCVTGSARLAVPNTAAGATVQRAFAGSFVEVELTDDWLTAAWIKLLSNSAGGAITTLARRSNRILGDREGAALCRALIDEAAAVGRADGARLGDDIAQRVVAGILAAAGDHHSSIVVDRLNGRLTEWQARNEVVVRKAAQHGLDVPLNRAMATLLRLGEPDLDLDLD